MAVNSLSKYGSQSPLQSSDPTHWRVSAIQFCISGCRGGWLPQRHKPNGSWSLHLRFLHNPIVLPGRRNVFIPDLTLSLLNLLSLLCPQVYLLSLVVQGPHLHSHLSGTSSAVFIPCRWFSTYQELLPGTSTAYLVQSELYSILSSLIVTVPPFLTLLHVNRSPMISPKLLPFRSGLPSSGFSPIHPSAFPTVPSASLTQRLGIPFEDFVIEINKEL